MIDKIKCENRIGNDIHKELIAMWNELQKGWIPPSHITEEEYISVRDNKEKYPDYYVGYVGFHATFGAKYFGGYARGFKADGITPRDESNEAYRNTMKQLPQVLNVKFTNLDYRNFQIKNAVIYCDPPYQGTTKYETESFNYDEFWSWCREMSKENWLFKATFYFIYVNNFSTLIFFEVSSPLLQSKFAKCSFDHIYSKSSGALYSLTKSQFYRRRLIMDRSFEYAKMQYEWIIKCLVEDEKWEELAFFELGVDLGIRIGELKNIKWEQIDFPLVKDVKVSKAENKEEYYKPLEISLNTFEAINRIYDNRVDDYIFQYNLYHYIGSISESIGTSFNGHSMRNISIVFKTNSIQEMKQ